MAPPVSPWAQIDGQPNTLPVASASPVWAPMPPDPHSGPVMPPAPVPKVNLAPQPDPSNPFAAIPPAQAPKVSLASDPLDQQIGSDQNKLQKVQREEANPWGTPENHPGKLGKLAHVFSEIGNVAGDIAIPRVMANIPGTQLNRLVQENQLSNRLGQEEAEQSENQGRAATTAKTQEETAEMPGKTKSEEELQAAEAAKESQPAADKYTFQQTDHGLMRIDSATGVATPVTYNGQPLNPTAKPEAPKGAEHVALLGDDGKPMLANYHPDTGKYTDINGKEITNPHPVPPPPNYGELMLPTKTATYIDPATNLPTEMQWDEKTQKYDKPLGLSASNAYGHEAAQAGAVERSADSLIQTLQANKDKLGNLGAWVKKYGLNTPIADPTLEGIRAQLQSFAALNPAMHGARGAAAMDHFTKLIGDVQQNPDATIAGIRGLVQGAAQPILGHGPGGEPQRPAHVPEGYVHKDNGPHGPGWYKP